MRRLFAALLLATAAAAQTPRPFTLQQILSAPYATQLTAAPVGNQFAWVENAEGVRNLCLGSATAAARQITHYTQDDGQDISSLAWSPDASAIAYTYGAENGAAGRPANPAHLQRNTAAEIILQPVNGGGPMRVGEGHAPLFTRDGSSILFVRSGQIFIADLGALKNCVVKKSCPPEQTPAASSKDPVEGPATVPVLERLSATFSRQLVFDRGTASSLTLSPDGAKLAYISHRRTHSFVALFDLKARALTFPAPSTGDDSAPVFSPDGKQLAWLRAPFTQPAEFAANRVSANPWSIQLADLTTNMTRTLFTPDADKPGSVLPHLATGEPRLFFTAGSKIVFYSEADGWVHLYLLDPSSSRPPQLLTPGSFEVEDAGVYQGETLLFASNCPSNTSLCTTGGPASGNASFDPLDRDRRHLWQIDLPYADKSPPAQLTHGAGIETRPVTNGTQVAALVSDARTPMQAALIDSHGVATPLHPGAVPASYPASQLLTPKQVLFPSADKLFQRHGQLFLPRVDLRDSTHHRHPAILFFHGGPHRQMLLGYPAMDYYSNAYAMNQYLASRGYVVLSVNYRCGIGYGLEFRQCEHSGADGASEYSDALGAAVYLRSRPDVDPTHIGIWGGSYGGYFVGLALARNSDIFAAGVDFHGVHDWNLEDNASEWRRGNNAQRDAIAARAFASSPMADIAKWRSPVLLIHGDDDPDVAFAQTPTLADALRARRVPVEELIFPDEVHDFLLHKDWLTAYQAAAAFFDRTLKPARSVPTHVP